MSDDETGAVAPEGETTTVTTVAPAPAATDPAMEDRARRMGWRPKEEYRGNPDNWTDAQTFVERGEQALPVLRERYRALDDRFARQETQLRQTTTEMADLKGKLNEAVGALRESLELGTRAEQRAYLRAKAEYEAQMQAAVQSADVQAYGVAKRNLDVLEEGRVQPRTASPSHPASPAPAQPSPAPNPVVTQWIAENTWFNVNGNGDPVMTAYATARDIELSREQPGLSDRERLNEVRADVARRFPEKFNNARRESAPAVSAPAAAPARSSSRKTKGFSDLPEEAKASFARFKTWMPDYKPEDYAKTYFAGDGA